MLTSTSALGRHCPRARADHQTTRRPGGSTLRRPAVGWPSSRRRRRLWSRLFVVPLGILVYMSFTDWPLLGSPTFNGLDNYRQLGADDQFLGAIKFTLLYTAITTVVLFAVAFALVAISEQPAPGEPVLPHGLLPAVRGRHGRRVVDVVGRTPTTSSGVFNQVLQTVGLTDQPAGLLATPDQGALHRHRVGGVEVRRVPGASCCWSVSSRSRATCTRRPEWTVRARGNGCAISRCPGCARRWRC